jgi:hypothetical protein
MLPDPAAEHTLKFVHENWPSQTPRWISVEPADWAAEHACVEVVDRLVQEQGGARLLGWMLWEWPNVFIEGEFHAIWQRPDGTVTDPTPKKPPLSAILFVLDPTAQITTWQKENVRKPLKHRREILDYLDIKGRIHRAINKGQEAYMPTFTHTPYIEDLFRKEHEILQRLIKKVGPPPTPPA